MNIRTLSDPTCWYGGGMAAQHWHREGRQGMTHTSATSTIYPRSIRYEFEDTLDRKTECERHIHVAQNVHQEEGSAVVLQIHLAWNYYISQNLL